MIEIYRITNLINDKCYVGQSKYGAIKRFQQHCKADSLIGKAIRKYGHENFLVEVLDSTDDVEEANELEHYHVLNNNCVVPNGYNMNEYGRLIGGSPSNQFWYIGFKPKYYHEINKEEYYLLYLNKLLSLSDKNFVLKVNHKTNIKNWSELFKIIDCKNRITQQKFKKFLLDNNLIEIKNKKFILNKEKFKIIY